jgi:hypothetical protein
MRAKCLSTPVIEAHSQIRLFRVDFPRSAMPLRRPSALHCRITLRSIRKAAGSRPRQSRYHLLTIHELHVMFFFLLQGLISPFGRCRYVSLLYLSMSNMYNGRSAFLHPSLRRTHRQDSSALISLGMQCRFADPLRYIAVSRCGPSERPPAPARGNHDTY